MSDHRTYEARFGALLDGDLDAQASKDVEAHLAECAQCAAAWHRYVAGIDVLRLTPDLPTPPAHVSAVMARVVGTARPPAAPTPAPRLGAAPRTTARWRSVSTHAAALAAGVLASIALLARIDAREARESRDAAEQAALARALVERETAGALAATEAARAQTAALTLVGAQLAAARRTSEQRSAHEREARLREGERLAAATQRASAERAASEAAAAAALARSFERLCGTLARLDAERVARVDTSPRVESAPLPETEPQRPEAPSARDWRAIDVDTASLAATGRRAEHVTIRRDGDRVALSTSGTLDDIVAALLARLDDPDPAVRAAVELRLDDIAAELGVARAEVARPRKSADEPWWRSDRGQVAALTIGGAGDTREPWPAWWARARSAVGH
jgi:hypothetical protein